MIRYWSVPPEKCEAIVRPDPEFIRQWLSVRPGVLSQEHQDIFAPNCRSQNQPADFSRVERVEHWQDADVIVCQHWFDLAMASGRRVTIEKLIDFVRSTYRDKVYAFSWNHDTDAAYMQEFNQLPKSSVLLQYNTSRPNPHDLLLPFWTSIVQVEPQPKTIRCIFRGYIGGSLRCRKYLKMCCDGKEGIVVTGTRLESDAYMRELASATFALCPRGGGLNSYRLYEAIACEAIPVLYADNAVLPYPEIGWESFSIRLPEQQATNWRLLDETMRAADVPKMQERLRDVKRRFSLAGVQEAVADRLATMIPRAIA